MASVRPFMAPCPGMAPRRSFLSSLLLLVVTACSGDPAAEPTTEQRVGLKTAGENCTAGTECDSGFCGDGVCCTTACNGTCVACAATLKQSLSASGTCGPALEGLDPQSSCDADAVGGCGKTGSCDGKGACALVPQGAACGTDGAPGMGTTLEVEVLSKFGHQNRSEPQLRKGDRPWEGSGERNRGPTNRNRIRGGVG